MGFLAKGELLILGRSAHFQSINHHEPLSSDLRASIERLFHIARLAVVNNRLRR